MDGGKAPAWGDLEGLVELLRDAHPDVDPRGNSDSELRALVGDTAGSDCDPAALSAADLEAVRALWHWGF
jgi:FeS assembly protein IscX